MKGLSGPTFITSFNPFAQSAIQEHALGQKAEAADGRIFRYGKAGAADITLGYLAVMPDQDTAELNMTVTAAAAIGATSVAFTNAATTATANEYAEGYLSVDYGTGIGQTLKIKSHAALTSGGASVVYLEDPLVVALDTTSRVGLTPNVYSGVITCTTDAAISVPCGVPLNTITTLYYGWFQTRGVVALAADYTIAAGYEIQADVNDAGKIDVTGTDAQVWKIGHALQGTADTYSKPVFLTID